MTLGEKIKRVRIFRRMSQKELGVACGLSEKNSDVRISQYESDYRVPKKGLILQIAKVLDVNPLSFLVSTPKDIEDVMQLLFWFEEENPELVRLFELLPKGQRDEINTQDCHIDMDIHIGIWFDSNFLNKSLKEWIFQKQKLRDGRLTQEEYFEWKIKWNDGK